MKIADKFPHLTDADLASLLSIHRVLAYDDPDPKFKGVDIPRGLELIEVISDRLNNTIAADHLANSKTVSIDLSYAFRRNGNIHNFIYSSLVKAKLPQFTAHGEIQVAKDTIEAIEKLSLVAKNELVDFTLLIGVVDEKVLNPGNDTVQIFRYVPSNVDMSWAVVGTTKEQSVARAFVAETVNQRRELQPLTFKTPTGRDAWVVGVSTGARLWFDDKGMAIEVIPGLTDDKDYFDTTVPPVAQDHNYHHTVIDRTERRIIHYTYDATKAVWVYACDVKGEYLSSWLVDTRLYA